MESPTHLVVLLQQLYDGQQATVRTEYGDTEHFGVEEGVHHGCILSAILFSKYTGNLIRDALAGYEDGIKIGGRSTLIINKRRIQVCWQRLKME